MQKHISTGELQTLIKKEYDNSVADNTKAIGLSRVSECLYQQRTFLSQNEMYRNAFEDYLKALIISPVSELAGRNLKILVEELNQNKDLIPADFTNGITGKICNRF